MKDLDFKKNSLSLYFVIAYALPIFTTIIVVLVAGSPSGIVVKEMSAAAVVVVMAMVHAPTIAAVIVVFRSQGLEGIKILFQQLKYWKFAPQWYFSAILIFPATMLAVLFALSSFSASFVPVLALNIFAFGALFSSLWEEIGWTGFATPVASHVAKVQPAEGRVAPRILACHVAFARQYLRGRCFSREPVHF
jgi:hypothetical protein